MSTEILAFLNELQDCSVCDQIVELTRCASHCNNTKKNCLATFKEVNSKVYEQNHKNTYTYAEYVLPALISK